ncbi:hypothetical protein [Rhizobium leguminosarum]|uniref:hypothetical protein n=1 Tax=Rhizobium leguminosarum TaxID=384 RepID=UPI003D7C1D82
MILEGAEITVKAGNEPHSKRESQLLPRFSCVPRAAMTSRFTAWSSIPAFIAFW